jgi:hypothetical protein
VTSKQNIRLVLDIADYLIILTMLSARVMPAKHVALEIRALIPTAFQA